MTDAEFEAKARAVIAHIQQGNLQGLNREPGMCQAFAGRFFTLCTGKHYLVDGRAGSAKAAYFEMLDDGKGRELGPKEELRAGDVLFWLDGKNGHVAIYSGGGRVVENTTSGRGEAINSKLSRYIRSGTTIRSGYHAMRREDLITEAYAGPPRVVVLPMAGRPQVVLDALDKDGVLYVPARAAFEAVGLEVHAEHLQDQGKVYIKEAGS